MAEPAFTLVHLAILGGHLHPVCEDVQAAGKYDVLKFTIETTRFRVFFLIFHFFVALHSIWNIHWTDRDVRAILFVCLFLQTPKFKSYLTRILIEKIDSVILY